MNGYLTYLTVLHSSPIPPTILTDPDDDHVLACAVTAKADLIVLGICTYEILVPIVNVAEALRRSNETGALSLGLHPANG